MGHSIHRIYIPIFRFGLGRNGRLPKVVEYLGGRSRSFVVVCELRTELRVID